MITYLYWAVVIAAAFGLVFLFGARFSSWKGAAIAAGIVLLLGWAYAWRKGDLRWSR